MSYRCGQQSGPTGTVGAYSTGDGMSFPKDSAAAQGLACCHVCGELGDVEKYDFCRVCHAHLHLRIPNSLQICLAFLFTACVCYIPASVLPIMYTEQLGSSTSNTIVGGVVTLWMHGSYLIASVIFIASVIVPIGKMMAIAWLCFSVIKPDHRRVEQQKVVYEITEFIGKWSMVDVFVVALLVALVQVGGLMSIKPGGAGLAFAGVVIFTMISARAFDSRLIWDRGEKQRD
jgi:paraquat-inducible protein A